MQLQERTFKQEITVQSLTVQVNTTPQRVDIAYIYERKDKISNVLIAPRVPITLQFTENKVNVLMQVDRQNPTTQQRERGSVSVATHDLAGAFDLARVATDSQITQYITDYIAPVIANQYTAQ